MSRWLSCGLCRLLSDRYCIGCQNKKKYHNNASVVFLYFLTSPSRHWKKVRRVEWLPRCWCHCRHFIWTCDLVLIVVRHQIYYITLFPIFCWCDSPVYIRIGNYIWLGSVGWGLASVGLGSWLRLRLVVWSRVSVRVGLGGYRKCYPSNLCKFMECTTIINNTVLPLHVYYYCVAPVYVIALHVVMVHWFVQEWLAQLSEKTYVTWRVSKTYPESGRKNIFKLVMRCQHNTVSSAVARCKRTVKNTNCPATLHITVKRSVS